MIVQIILNEVQIVEITHLITKKFVNAFLIIIISRTYRNTTQKYEKKEMALKLKLHIIKYKSNSESRVQTLGKPLRMDYKEN